MIKTRISEEALQRIKATLQKTYGDRFKGVVLYGSEARGDAGEDSDIDLLALLTGPVVFGDEIQTIIDAIYPIQLEMDRVVSVRPADIAVYEKGEFPFYRNVKEEGVLL